MKKRVLISILALGITAIAIYFSLAINTPEASPTTSPTMTPTAAPTATPTQTIINSEYLQIFEMVWSTVNQTYFDPDFGGVDWAEIHDQYEPLINEVEDDETLYLLLNHMLWELNVSHTGVGPADMWPSIEPAAWGKGEIGIDVRLIDKQAVITRVKAESPAEAAGLRPGFVINSIEAVSVEQIITDAENNLAPPYNTQGRIDNLTRSLLGIIYGEPGTCVTLTYLDETDKSHEGCIERIERLRTGVMEGIPLPPSYLEFESGRLANEIGYIRFNTFHPDLIPDLINAIVAMQDAPGIVIDLRGNPGGEPTTADQLAAQFIAGQGSLGSFRIRSETIERSFTGNNVFSGPLVILIDALSFSASEYFSSGMQAAGRALIIGERSPGGTTGMNVINLPNGALLGYPVAQLISTEGVVLEGYGVIPDISVSLKRSQLLEGFDAQLEAAIEYISTHSP